MSDPNELSIPADWRPAPLTLEVTADPAALPALDQIQDAVDTMTFLGDRAKRIFAVGRWAGVVAITEMRDGYDAAQRVVMEGPQVYYPTDDDFDRINLTSKIAINYVESGATP
jgi:hypothetical protein